MREIKCRDSMLMQISMVLLNHRQQIIQSSSKIHYSACWKPFPSLQIFWAKTPAIRISSNQISNFKKCSISCAVVIQRQRVPRATELSETHCNKSVCGYINMEGKIRHTACQTAKLRRGVKSSWGNHKVKQVNEWAKQRAWKRKTKQKRDKWSGYNMIL